MPPFPSWRRLHGAAPLCRLVALACLVTSCSEASKPVPGLDGGAGSSEPPPSTSGALDAGLGPTMDATSIPSVPVDAASPDTGTSDAAVVVDRPPTFSMRTIVRGLAGPWQLSAGFDEALWVTERVGARVTRVDPARGTTSTLLQLADVYQQSGQDGLLGMALEPGSDLVYLVYTYDADGGAEIDRRARLVRYRYLEASLIEPTPLLEGLPASSDHNAGRLVLGPDQHLYYSIGDQGKNQFDRRCEPIAAQLLPTQSELDLRDYRSYEGKILRIALDGSVPPDNPVIAGVRSHVFSYGHRNPQGLAFAPDGTLYASEQGPKTDDELNRIVAGGNYGWPYVAGFRDDRGYVYGAWAGASDCAQLSYSDYAFPASVQQQAESAWMDDAFVPPLRTFYTVDSDHDFLDSRCGDSPYICWPTVAPSSLAIYSSLAIPSWTGSFLITSLKDGAVHRFVGDYDELVFRTVDRYRDLLVAADGRTFYVATDASGATRALDGSPTKALAEPGAILEFRLSP